MQHPIRSVFSQRCLSTLEYCTCTHQKQVRAAALQHPHRSHLPCTIASLDLFVSLFATPEPTSSYSKLKYHLGSVHASVSVFFLCLATWLLSDLYRLTLSSAHTYDYSYQHHYPASCSFGPTRTPSILCLTLFRCRWASRPWFWLSSRSHSSCFLHPFLSPLTVIAYQHFLLPHCW